LRNGKEEEEEEEEEDRLEGRMLSDWLFFVPISSIIYIHCTQLNS